MTKPFVDFCEDKARAGDGAFAIAYALMQVADAQEDLAKKVGQLGFDGPGHNMGALEHIGVRVGDIAHALENFGLSATISGSLETTNA